MRMTRRNILGSGVACALGAVATAVPFPVLAGTERTFAVDVWSRAIKAARFRIIAAGNVAFVAANMTARSDEGDLLYVTDDSTVENRQFSEFLKMATYSYRMPTGVLSVGHAAASLISTCLAKSSSAEGGGDVLPATCVIVAAPQCDDEWRAVAIAAAACKLRGEPVVGCVAACPGCDASGEHARLAQMTTDHFWLFPPEIVARSESPLQLDEALWLPYADFLAGICAGIARGTVDPTRLPFDVEAHWCKQQQPIFKLAQDYG